MSLAGMDCGVSLPFSWDKIIWQGSSWNELKANPTSILFSLGNLLHCYISVPCAGVSLFSSSHFERGWFRSELFVLPS